MEPAQTATSLAALRSEQGLVIAARRGDDRAFEALYAQYRDRVYSFILSKVRDHGRAEDICQEVFMSALRQLRSSGQEIAFKPWIFAIAKNACIDEFRRASRGREVPVETDEALDAGARGLHSVASTPAAAIESKQSLDDLRGAFGGLSDSHHRLLVMREFEGRSYDEIGERLGMTRQMVESGIFRARRKLSEEYEELATGRRCEQVQTVIETGGAKTLRAMGIKQRRRVSRHLSHCEACRLHARIAGVDETLLKPRIGEKIAALLPFGGLWKWRPWRAARGAGHGSSGHIGTGAIGGAGKAVGLGGSSMTLGQAAATVAVLAIASGGGVAYADHAGPFHRPASIRHAAAGSGHGSSGSSASSAAGSSSSARTASGAARTAAGTHATTAGRAAGTGATAAPTAGGSASQKMTTRREIARRSATGAGGPASSSSSGAPATGSTTVTRTARPIRGRSGAAGKAVSTLGPTLTKVTAPIQKIADPVVQKVVDPVLSAPPVKKVLSTVGSLLPPSSGAGSASTAPTAPAPSGSTSANPLQDPPGTIKKTLGVH
jgi:RNA polymerase sigma factor (sigma-70 family)